MGRRAAAAVAVAIAVLDAGVAAAQSSPAAAPASVSGGEVSGAVRLSRAGVPQARADGVVVYLVGFTEPPPAAVPRIEQKGRAFVPDLVAITAGQEVAFPNADPILHNVFSPSSTRAFDLGEFKRGASKQKAFPRTGVVDVYCNIHPEMSATILVLPNRRFARTDADGRFRIAGVPPCRWKLYAYSRRAGRPAVADVGVAAGRPATATLALDETKLDFAHPNKHGEPYRAPDAYRR